MGGTRLLQTFCGLDLGGLSVDDARGRIGDQRSPLPYSPHQRGAGRFFFDREEQQEWARKFDGSAGNKG